MSTERFGDSIDWREILNRLEALATSELGRSRLRTLSALRTPEEAKASFTQIEQAREVLLMGQRPFAESLDLFSTWHSRLKRDAVLQTLEIRDVR